MDVDTVLRYVNYYADDSANLHADGTHLKVLANLRFDLAVEEEMFLHSGNNVSANFNTSVHSHLPDPSLGYTSSSTGSDILSQSLRKTCHSLRNFIDDVKPDPKFRNLHMRIHPEAVWIQLNYKDPDELNLFYENDENGCTVDNYNSGKTKKFEKTDFLQVFSQDFNTMMSNQRKVLDLLKITFFDISEISKFQNFMGFRKIKIQKVNLRVANHDQLTLILSIIDPSFLEFLIISNVGMEMDIFLEVDKLVETEQWKKLRKLEICNFLVLAPIRKFQNFEILNLKFKKVTVDDVMEWKNMTQTRKIMKSYSISFETCNAEQHFINTYGPGEQDTDMYGKHRKSWYFRIPEADFLVEISFYNDHLCFDRLEMSHLPIICTISD